MTRNPLHYAKKFFKEIKADLGAEDKPFRVTDCNKRIAFGKQTNFQRSHYLVCVILEHLLRNDAEKAALQCALTLQSLHQASLDNDWQVAWLLTHQEDPFKKKVFGGSAEELQNVTSYLRSMNELAKTTDSLRRKGQGKGDQADAEKDSQKGGKGNRRAGKNKQQQQDKTTADP